MPGGDDVRVVPYVDLARQFAGEQEALGPILMRTLAEGQWVGGPQVQEFEDRVAHHLGVAQVVAVASGTDALVLAMRALDIGPGDEVITPPNSFVASTAAIVQVGACPVFADVLPDQSLDPAAVARVMTDRTKAIMPVHLTGRMAPMTSLLSLAREWGVRVIEDAAQSYGSRLDGRFAGTMGDVGCFSAHPLKNLNAMGDAGFIVTHDNDVAARLRRLRNNGLVDRNTVAEWGTVSRLDTLQAVVLLHRLESIDDIIERRRANAARYRALLDPELVFAPTCEPGQFNTFHTFVIQVERRDELQAYLAERGVGTSIHYPVPIHLQPAAAALGYGPGDFPVAERQATRILSLPIHQFITGDDVRYVAATINGFFK